MSRDNVFAVCPAFTLRVVLFVQKQYQPRPNIYSNILSAYRHTKGVNKTTNKQDVFSHKKNLSAFTILC